MLEDFRTTFFPFGRYMEHQFWPTTPKTASGRVENIQLIKLEAEY